MNPIGDRPATAACLHQLPAAALLHAIPLPAAWAPGQAWPPLPAAREERWTGLVGQARGDKKLACHALPPSTNPPFPSPQSPPHACHRHVTHTTVHRAVARAGQGQGHPAPTQPLLAAAASHASRYLYNHGMPGPV